MAGYIFAVSKDGWTDFCEQNLAKGFFTPFALEVSEDVAQSSRKRKARNKILSATLGDFVTMKPGDNVYFLSDRKIYGIGQLVNIGADCKYDNYEGASKLLPDCFEHPDDYLTTASTRARWVFFFEPAPHLFKKGVDMDDVLRYRPAAFRMLRAFEGLSFIKIDDEENRSLKEFISLANEQAYATLGESTFAFDAATLDSLRHRDLTPYLMHVNSALRDADNSNYVFSEMFVESFLLEQLTRGTAEAFGQWDYLSHQLIASPFKPLKYIDKIDIFGYRFSEHYEGSPKLITKYLLVELKKEKIDRAAVEQTMQYVDWICHEYASGDYSKVEAYVVGNDVARNLEAAIAEIAQRSYIMESHPVITGKWTNLHLVTYSIDEDIRFEEYHMNTTL